jgi:YHS domain-containing protein
MSLEMRVPDIANDEKYEEVIFMAKDPVCGMNVDEKKAAGTTQHKGRTYYFCSAQCKAQFDKAPDKYLKE